MHQTKILLDYASNGKYLYLKLNYAKSFLLDGKNNLHFSYKFFLKKKDKITNRQQVR